MIRPKPSAHVSRLVSSEGSCFFVSIQHSSATTHNSVTTNPFNVLSDSVQTLNINESKTKETMDSHSFKPINPTWNREEKKSEEIQNNISPQILSIPVHSMPTHMQQNTPSSPQIPNIQRVSDPEDEDFGVTDDESDQVNRDSQVCPTVCFATLPCSITLFTVVACSPPPGFAHFG